MTNELCVNHNLLVMKMFSPYIRVQYSLYLCMLYNATSNLVLNVWVGRFLVRQLQLLNAKFVGYSLLKEFHSFVAVDVHRVWRAAPLSIGCWRRSPRWVASERSCSTARTQFLVLVLTESMFTAPALKDVRGRVILKVCV